MKRSLVAMAAVLISAGSLSAQTRGAAPPAAGPGEIRGSIVDAENNAPISSASIGVWNQADKALVAGALAQPDGTFRIEGLRPGTYVLRMTMIGYATQTSAPLTISAAAPRAQVGAIKLVRSAVEVAAVEATAERAVIIAPDRNTYRAKDVAPGATNASDVLENVPSVQVDAEGKLSLRGNENVVVQINGRPTPIRGTQLASYLRQLPANTIERVDVIPNPSAKHDPEGMAGIINIVMKQGVDLGTSGGLSVSASTSERYNAGGNIGHQSGPLTLFLTYGYFNDERQVTGINDRTRLNNGLPLSYTEQDVTQTTNMAGHNVGLNSDYSFNKRDVLSTTLQFNYRGADDGSNNFYNELTGSRQLIDQYDRLRDADNSNLFADASLAFKRTITPQKHELSAELRFNHQDDDDNTLMWREDSNSATRLDGQREDVDALTKQVTAQLDYTRELGKSVKLETGYKGNARWLDRDFAVSTDSLGTGTWRRSDRSNALELDEQVNAVYAVISRGGNKVDLQGGLRAEYASRDFTLADTGENFPNDYVSLFPSAVVNYKLNDKSQAKVSYSRRIRRPGTQELNPFPVYFDVHNVFLGNPGLDPEYTDAIELGYQRSGQLGSLQISPFYRYTSDIIRVNVNTADTINGREVTTISFENLEKSTSWGADINSQLRFSPALSAMASFNVFKMVTDGGSESALSSNAVSWMTRFSGTYNVDANTSVTATYFYRAPVNIERGRFGGGSNANLAVRRKLMGEKAVATVRWTDPFNTARFKVNVGDDNVIQLTERRFNARALHLSLQYNFGTAPKLRQRRQEEQQQGSTPFGG